MLDILMHFSRKGDIPASTSRSDAYGVLLKILFGVLQEVQKASNNKKIKDYYNS
jgi:hypothetical protein